MRRTLRTLDSSLSIYTGVAWRKNADDLAVLRSKTDARHDGPIFCGLAYAGEDHGLRKKANQFDYHRRIIEWFGH
jgi:hypothetical protein